MNSIQAAKSALRSQMESKLAKLTADERRRQSDNIVKKLLSSPAFLNSQRISVYLSTEGEVDTEPIVRKIFELNKKCFVPRALFQASNTSYNRYNKNIMEMVELKDMDDWANLPLTKWQIKQPKLSDVRENALDAGGLDLVILPGVAFTKDGKRLGHGKGYYDSYQHEVFKRQAKRPTTIAVAFKEQVVDDVPTHDHDVKLDMVLTSE